MFNIDQTSQDEKEPRVATGDSRRTGSPIDVRRVAHAIIANKRMLVSVVIAASIAGITIAKLALPKTYAANATLLWEPPPALHGEASRELVTLAQSVKLPANLLLVRDGLHRDESVERLAKSVDVTFGDNTMLIGITGSDHDPAAAAQLTNKVVDVFLGAQREIAANRLRGSVDALRESLRQSESALADSRAKYDAFRAEYHVDDFSLEVQSSIVELARLRTSAHDAEIELHGLQAQESALAHAQSASAPIVITSTSEEHTDEARLARSETELAALRSKYSEDHPSVLALAAEVNVLKQRAKTLPPAVTAQTLGRNPIYDAIATQAQESRVGRSSMEERAKALAEVQREAEARAKTLTGVQGEAARFLADVNTNEEHVNLLLKQLAMAEDDVRGATSGFQLVSRATPPDHAERGFGRIVAIALPLAALLTAIAIVIWRELRGMRVKTTNEAAFWARAPVLASTAWPNDNTETVEPMSRYIADAFEGRQGVVGISAMRTGIGISDITHAVADRLRWRGKRCAVIEVRDEEALRPLGYFLADALENHRFTNELAELRANNDLVFVLAPPVSDPISLRASLRGVDALLVVLESGDSNAADLGGLRATLGLESLGIGLVITNVPSDLVSWSERASGDSNRVWRCSAPSVVEGEA
jgi:uncharacterized protein involved in exopolysaccharide biosynthesis